MRRHAFTLVELSIALVIAAVILIAAYQAILVMARTQKSTDVKSSRALLEAQLLETLQLDLRSRICLAEPTTPTAPPPTGVFTEFQRYVLEDRRLIPRTVKWAQVAPDRVVREEGELRRVFDFHGLLDPDVRSVEFRLVATQGEFLSPDPAGAK